MRKGQWPSFAARPYICGVLGTGSPERLAALRAAGPDVVPVHQVEGVTLLANRPLEPYHTVEDGGRETVRAYAFGDRRPRATPDPSWVRVAEDDETAGLILEPDRVLLHSGGFGLVPVYYTVRDGAVYFAGAIDPLLAVLDGRPEINWPAWAAILQMTCPLSDDTPFTAVRRLAPSTALVWSRSRRRISVDRRMPRWVRTEPADRAYSPADFVDAMSAVFDRLRGEPLTIPLSGGYDSRLLASVASSRRADIRSWTTSPDDGTDADIGYARAVAHALGIPHEVHLPEADDYPAYALAVARRLEFQASHHAWFGPFTEVLHQAGRTVVDGLAGGVMLKNTFLKRSLKLPPGPDRREAMFQTLALREPDRPLVAAPAMAWIDGEVRRRFDDATANLRGHRCELQLSTIYTRSLRAIGCSPISLIGPEVPVVLPFFAAEPLEVALSVPPSLKVNDRFYLDVLQVASPAAAELPHTHKDMPKATIPLRSRGPAATAWALEMLATVAAVPGLLDPAFAQAVAAGPAGLDGYTGWFHRLWLRGLVLFGAWLTDYAGVLDDLTPPWAGARGPLAAAGV